MNETMPTSEVLNRAADLIEERGWGQGQAAMVGADGVCVMGAIHAAMFGSLPGGAIGDGYIAVGTCPAGIAVGNYLDYPSRLLCTWNDRPARTASEVIEVLRACAVIEASRERETAEVSS